MIWQDPQKLFSTFFINNNKKFVDYEYVAKYICHPSLVKKGNNKPFIEKGKVKFTTNVKYRF